MPMQLDKQKKTSKRITDLSEQW